MPTAPIESSGSIKFDDQTFLISYFADITKDFPTPFSFANCYKLNNNTSIPMSELIGIFNNTVNLSSFLNLNTHQYSALIPRIKLYRVEYDESGVKKSDKEFIFNKDYKFEIGDILSTPKRDNSGIKRINWRLAGSNPVTAEKQIEVEIELYFDSISSFSSGDFDTMKKAWTSAVGGYDPSLFRDFDTDTTTRNYWSLLFHPKKTKNDESISGIRDRYDTKYFRIRANVGWEQVESNITNQLFENLDINEEIKKLNYSFMLNLVEHKFNFNEDGSLNITANYIATFENSTHNYDFNLLGNLKRDLEALKSTGIGNLYDQFLFGRMATGGGQLDVTTTEQSITNAEIQNDPLSPDSIARAFINQGVSTTFDLNLTEADRIKLTDQIKDLTLNDLNEISKIYSNPETLKCLRTSGLIVATPAGNENITLANFNTPTIDNTEVLGNIGCKNITLPISHSLVTPQKI